MKGLKIWKDNLSLINEHKNIYDFFEVYVDSHFPIKELRKFPNAKITIHAAHNHHGFDPSKKSKHEQCKQLINLAIKAADIVNAPWIIVHPGIYWDKDSRSNIFNFFDNNWDDRIIFENCIVVDRNDNDVNYLFSTPEDMKTLLSRYNARMVLDFGHAICSANILKVKPEKFIYGFLKLNPKCFHVSGIEMNAESDTHLNLLAVSSKMKYLKKVDKSKYFTFETDCRYFNNKEIQITEIKFFENCF